jgi:hypothetical protein
MFGMSSEISNCEWCEGEEGLGRGGLGRRRFLAGVGAAMAGVGGVLGPGRALAAEGGGAARLPAAETLVKSLYDSLSEEQRGKVVVPFADPLRERVENNWHILPQRVGTCFTTDQQANIREIFLKMHSEEYRDEVWKAFLHDNRESGKTTEEEIFGTASVAIFGVPGSGQFEFVVSGRHCTRRCDGDSTEGVAFGGPIFYGHAAEGFRETADHPGNAYWFQAKRANEVYQMLDGGQRELALCQKMRPERSRQTVELRGEAEGLESIRVGELSEDQRDHVRKVLADLLLPFREEDRKESLRLVEGQFEDLHLAFYREGDIGDDGVWDNWQLEGPNMIWHFRGAPHVHTWVHVREGG